MILVPLLNPKFATVPAEKSCELRVRGTREAVYRRMRTHRPSIDAELGSHLILLRA
jgi:hypothetical protein